MPIATGGRYIYRDIPRHTVTYRDTVIMTTIGLTDRWRTLIASNDGSGRLSLKGARAFLLYKQR